MKTKTLIFEALTPIGARLVTFSHDLYLLLVLIFLSILGVGIADAFEEAAHWYWVGMVPVFFGAGVLHEWRTFHGAGPRQIGVLVKQIQHWAGVGVAFFLAFKLREIGSLDNQVTGLMLLLILALGTFLAGISMGWLFLLLGVFLGFCLILVAYTEHYVGVLIATGAATLVLYHYLAKSMTKKVMGLERQPGRAD